MKVFFAVFLYHCKAIINQIDTALQWYRKISCLNGGRTILANSYIYALRTLFTSLEEEIGLA